MPLSQKLPEIELSKFRFDTEAALSGLRTLFAVLIVNSVLIYTEVFKVNLAHPLATCLG